MTRSKLAAVFALATIAFAAVPAFAGQKDDPAQFPMAAAQFRQKVEQRQQKMRERFEAAVAEKKIPAEKVAEIRARMTENQAKLKAEVDKVCADGTVTLDEAKAFKQLAKSLHPHHGGKHHQRG
jgi:transketolase